jgi:sulfonate transport system substrate-binding protein
MKRRSLLQLAASGAALALPALPARAAPLDELRLDYAHYSPTSLVLRHFGWLEEEFKGDGTRIKWVFSAGSNRALEYLNANSIDIGSSATRFARHTCSRGRNGRRSWCRRTPRSARWPT